MGKAKVNTKGVVGRSFQTCPVLDRNPQHAAFPNPLYEIWDVVNAIILLAYHSPAPTLPSY